MLPQLTHHLSRRLRTHSLAALLATGAIALAPSWVQAQEFLSIKGSTVNIRTQPNTKSDIAWELINGYPVEVVGKQGDWLKVRDFEGPLGWVHKPLTSSEPYFLVKGTSVNLRSGPGTQHGSITKLHKYDIVQTLEKRDGWAKVKTYEGQEGWMLEKLGWGW